MGNGDVKEKIAIKVKLISNSAKEKIEKAGGTIIIESMKKEDIKQPKKNDL